ncbi:MAG: heparan-alpha-glucosaminide N-acetyltransferase domain-containing protein [Bacteroidota bacterium]
MASHSRLAFIDLLPFFSFHRTTTEATEVQWLRFYQSDVLHCIALSLLVLFLTRLLIRNDRTYRIFLFSKGVLVVLTTMFIWNINFNTWIPAPPAAYFNSQHYSLFPLFPWMAFMLFGGVFASGYIRAREQQKEKGSIFRFALTGAILFAVCAIGRELPVHLHIGSNDIRANPLFFFERLGIVMLLLTACWFYANYRKTEKIFFFGRQQGIVDGICCASVCDL